MLELAALVFILIVPGAIPAYCIATFLMGIVDGVRHKVEVHHCTKRYQVYSLYKPGIKFGNWMNERVV